MASKLGGSSREVSHRRPFQHKKVAFWFYRFLSVVYDQWGTGVAWTEEIRDAAMERANLCHRRLRVLDVGGGTGYSTLAIVKHVDAENVTILDQSSHQLAKAREKAALRECTIVQGDAEDLPFPTDYADRYISAGCIEYWPEPQRGINEAYRVLKPGGMACVIGPLYPTFWLSRFFADLWMLFPKEEEYVQWFKKAGFQDIEVKIDCPTWYRGARRHGLIMGCWVTGVKNNQGDSPLELGPKCDDLNNPVNPFCFLSRFIQGFFAGIYFVLISYYMWIKHLLFPKGMAI
uniref:Inner envelope membrane protein, chloroplastic n=1 Tax=Anthurium amnicola TaxID=1678845 RepID=A0A1D1Z573_9ARAE